MNERQRFIETMTCGFPDRPSYGEYLYYESTRKRWESEGMPVDVDIYRHFGLDHIDIWDKDCIPCDWMFNGLYERKLLEDTDEYQIWRETSGIVNKYLKNMPPPAMPLHLSFPVSDRDSWNDYKIKILESDSKIVIDSAMLKKWKDRTTPLGLWAGSSFGIVRNMCSVEQLSFMIYDNPELVLEIMDFLTEIYIDNFKSVTEKVELDWVMFWEDMSYKNGSLVSPKKYKELFVPFYKKIMPLVEAAGIKVVMLDSDGNIDELIPIWLDLGINTMHPLEVAAGMDIRNVRKKYGRKVRFYGGIDKRALSKDRKSIDAEVIPKLRAMADDGGFIAACDHAVPPDVSYDNFRYYRDLIRKTSEA